LKAIVTRVCREVESES